MKIDREEKRSLKKLLVGILVAAMVVTMLPVCGVNNIEAAEINIPQNGVMTVEARTVEGQEDVKTAEQVIRDAFIEYGTVSDDFPNGLSDMYPNGIVVNVYEDVNLSGFETGGIMPQNVYFVFKEAVNIYGFDGLCRGAKTETGMNVYVLGAGSLYAMRPETGTEIEDCYVEQGINVTIASTVDTSLICFYIEKSEVGGENGKVTLLGENKVIELPVDSKYSVACYNKTEGWYSYNSSEILVEEIGSAYIEENSFDVEIYKNVVGGDMEVDRVVYTENAMNSLPAGVTLTYDNNCEVAEYTNPRVSLIVDKINGLYNLEKTEDSVTMIVYSMRSSRSHSYSETNQASTGTQIPVRLMMTDGFRYTEVVDGTEMSFDCDKVIFTESAIPDTYTANNNFGDPTEYKVDHIIIQDFSGPETTFSFDMKNHADFVVWNHTNVAVEFTNENNNELWVKWPEGLLGVEIQTDGYNSYFYTKAGVTHTITPSNDYTIYGVQLGDWADFETGGEYTRLAGMEYVTYNVDGTVDVTIPNFGSSVDYSEAPIEEVEDLTKLVISSTPLVKDTESTTDYYGDAFTIGMTGYEICDVTLDKSGNWSSSVTENTDGKFQKTYYVIDRTMEDDGVTPSRSYGRISKFEYSYVLDTSTPIITSVLATDANGEGINLEGGWLDAEGNNTVSVETVWTATPSITLNVIADSGNGLPVAEYKFVRALGDDADGEWQTSNTYTYTGDGVYDVVIHAKDEFDLGWESVIGTRPEAGMWVTAFGIDTSAPKLMFTDEKNATASELKADAQYEGNLQMVCDDGDGSGLAEINIYKKSGNQWVTSNELLVATEEGYYIAPNTQNEVYKIEVIDKAGNEMLYENITVVGKVQEKAAGTGSVVAEDIYFGQTVSPTATSDTNGTENVTYYYKKADAVDSTYTTEVPTATGTYKVKAVFAETANYKEVVAEDEFTITRISATTRMYSITEPNEDGIYEESVVIRGLNGHQLAVSESGVYREQITLSESVGFFRFYIKTPEGAITDAVVLRDIVIELEVPPTPILAGRAHLDTGAAYELGEGTWNVSGDSTNYVGGTVFYVPESGDYEFTQQEGGQ